MANNIETVSSFVLITSILISTLILVTYQYLTNLRGIRVKREFLDNVLPIIDSFEPYDLSNTEDNYLVFTRNRRRNKSGEQDNGVLFPEQLLAYSFILNPLRLAILKVLFDYDRYVSADLRKDLKVQWGPYTSHLNSLIDVGMISSNDEFVDAKPLKVLYLEDKGKQSFTRLKILLQEVVG